MHTQTLTAPPEVFFSFGVWSLPVLVNPGGLLKTMYLNNAAITRQLAFIHLERERPRDRLSPDQQSLQLILG